ncbi:MAG: ABC transporter permease [Erysipelotrichaceae bacterium]|nr:ABC transporter permease [Erysipelotrichaceae bacterium]
MTAINHREKTPLIRISKRENMSIAGMLAVRIGAFVLAIVLGGLIFACLGTNPIEAYMQMINGSLGKASGIRQVVKIAVPLLTVALALAPCFKMKYWNIGAEGQITIGAICCSYFALYWYDKLPSFVLLIVMAIAAILGGGIWALIPALFKSRYNTNETLFTLMMNYIAIGIAAWLCGGPWEGKPGSQIIPMFNEKAVLPKIGGVHIGWIFALIFVVVMFIYMNYTKQGYEIAVLGESENTARYAGMNVSRIVLRTVFISGALSGFAGYMVASGTDMTLFSNVANNVGFTAITVCWLSQLNPFVMVIISALIAILSRGSSVLQTQLSIPSTISSIITGIILLCLLGCEFFINYEVSFRKKGEN